MNVCACPARPSQGCLAALWHTTCCMRNTRLTVCARLLRHPLTHPYRGVAAVLSKGPANPGVMRGSLDLQAFLSYVVTCGARECGGYSS